MPKRMLRDWTTSEPINELSFEAEVFFVRLIMKADDHGNYTANEKLLKAALFPLRDGVDIAGMLTECVVAGIVRRYESGGKSYINIPNFGQRLRQMKSEWPQPADSLLTDCGEVPLELEEKRSRIEEEEKGKTRAWFDSCIDPIFRETLELNHKGKDIPQAMNEAWVYLQADPLRLHNSTSSDVKKLVNTWLTKSNGAPKQKPTRAKLI